MHRVAQALDQTFAALADPVRRAIVVRLARGDATVSELAEPFDISLPAISRHLRVLENANLIVRAADGRTRRCSLRPEALAGARDWLDHYGNFWAGSFDRLAALVETGPDNGGSKA